MVKRTNMHLKEISNIIELKKILMYKLKQKKAKKRLKNSFYNTPCNLHNTHHRRENNFLGIT